MRRYCAYCGRVAHRCTCAEEDSKLRQFLARGNVAFQPSWRHEPYQRAVPPQVKRKVRAQLRRSYAALYEEIATRDGEFCAHCGDNTAKLALDHVIPVAKGGESVAENLQLLCAECNRLKGKLVYVCGVNLRS